MKRVPITKGNEKWRLYLLVILAFVVGVVLLLIGSSVLSDDVWDWATLTSGVGVAFISSALIAFLVEAYLRESLYSEIRGQISDNLKIHRQESIDSIHFQRVLPAEVSELVRRTVVEQPLIERDTLVEYVMHVLNEETGSRLCAQITMTSIHENLTDEPRMLMLEEFTTVDAELLEVKMEGIDGDFDSDFHLTRDNIGTYLSHKRGYVIFSREIKFAPKSKARFTSKEIHYFELSDCEAFTCTRTTVNMEVRVFVPPKTFKFTGEPEHPVEAYFTSSVDNEKGRHSWRIIGALMPFQGISFNWEPW